eukprot:2997379-Rhodomonas_salina.2
MQMVPRSCNCTSTEQNEDAAHVSSRCKRPSSDGARFATVAAQTLLCGKGDCGVSFLNANSHQPCSPPTRMLLQPPLLGRSIVSSDHAPLILSSDDAPLCDATDHDQAA